MGLPISRLSHWITDKGLASNGFSLTIDFVEHLKKLNPGQGV